MNRGTRDMPDPQHLDPGQPAPVTGYYLAHDMFGESVAKVAPMRKGEPLPPLPKGFTWVPMEKW
jgi:hypothetical protein